MIKNIDAVDEIRKNRETTYKKCNYDLRNYCNYVTKEVEAFKQNKTAIKHDTKKAA
jgi:tetrahydrodipicolinate N-succinyltransferase